MVVLPIGEIDQRSIVLLHTTKASLVREYSSTQYLGICQWDGGEKKYLKLLKEKLLHAEHRQLRTRKFIRKVSEKSS